MLHSADMLNPYSYMYIEILSNMDSVLIMCQSVSINFILISYLPGIIPSTQEPKIVAIL
jgi:hypothetical protein